LLHGKGATGRYVELDVHEKESNKMMTFWSFFRSMAGVESGRWCRRCSEPINRHDHFGRSEGICQPCRTAA